MARSPSVVDEYWRQQSTRLRAEFEQLRAAHNDSAVKGTGNEQIVAEFLRRNYSHARVVTNSELIDAFGSRSGEVDVALCNDSQPFLSQGRAELLIAEGVDAVIQVKAVLSTAEIGRAVKNAVTIKKCKRSFLEGEEFQAHQADVPHYVERVPYVVVAFTSDLSAFSSVEKLKEACASVSSEHQIDGVFVLHGFSIFNIRQHDGVLQVRPKESRGFVALDTRDRTVAELMWFLYATVRGVRRRVHPLWHYFRPTAS